MVKLAASPRAARSIAPKAGPIGAVYDSFLYLDRIAVAAGARRQRLGTMLYDAIEDSARELGRMVLDVNVEPPNEPSLAFHAARGYRPLERLEHAEKTVVLMSKELGG